MKITIETTEPDEFSKLRRMLHADQYLEALNDVADKVFRPARKHGYNDPEIKALLSEDLPEAELLARLDLVAALETRFYEVLRENGVDLEDRP